MLPTKEVLHKLYFANFGTTIVGCNNFKIKLQQKSNQYVTHQTTSAQITIRKFWNYIKKHTCPTYKKVGP